jgi:hypothetical protein
MYLSHEQFDCNNVLWLLDGGSLPSRRRWRFQRLAMVSIKCQCVPNLFILTINTRLFIVDGIISLPVCIATFFFLPDVPEICTAFYLTKEEIAFAQKRMQLEVRMRGYRCHKPSPTRWRLDLSVQPHLYLSHYRVLLPVTESPKRFEVRIDLFGRWLDTR